MGADFPAKVLRNRIWGIRDPLKLARQPAVVSICAYVRDMRFSRIGPSNAAVADEAHEGAPAGRTEQHDVVALGRAALHAGRAYGHAGHGEAGRGRLLLQ